MLYGLYRLPGAKVTILEASDRVGGRAKSVYVESVDWVNLGATWLHGDQEQPLLEPCRKFGLLDNDRKKLSRERIRRLNKVLSHKLRMSRSKLSLFSFITSRMARVQSILRKEERLYEFQCDICFVLTMMNII